MPAVGTPSAIYFWPKNSSSGVRRTANWNIRLSKHHSNGGSMMRNVLDATLIATRSAACTSLAFELPSTQPIRGSEGPDVRLTQDG